MSSYVVVHPSGMDPFLSTLPWEFHDSKEVWGDDRALAIHFDKHEAVQKAEEKSRSFSDGRVVIDEVEHPEIEDAIVRCFLGDLAALSIVETYRRQCGIVSLKYFASRALFGDPKDRKLFSGRFNEVYEGWLRRTGSGP